MAVHVCLCSAWIQAVPHTTHHGSPLTQLSSKLSSLLHKVESESERKDERANLTDMNHFLQSKNASIDRFRVLELTRDGTLAASRQYDSICCLSSRSLTHLATELSDSVWDFPYPVESFGRQRTK